jgi:hypothetical protein
MTELEVSRISRTALIAVHDGSAESIEAAEAAHAATGVVIAAGTDVCRTVNGQAALMTAVATAARAFGTVTAAVSDPHTVVMAGLDRGRRLGDAIAAQGAKLTALSDLATVASDQWPILMIGPGATPPQRSSRPAPVLQALWSAWVASVEPATSPVTSEVPDHACVLAAIAAGALAVSEAFNALNARPGSDAGYRRATLNLWNPGSEHDTGPRLEWAPAQWWLVGLGHLGQANSWVLSWLGYRDPDQVQVVLQDTDRTILANHSTGLLTPAHSIGHRKTRLVAAALDAVGYDTRILERRVDASLRLTSADVHVALLGVDNLSTRRITSHINWELAIDAGLGAGHTEFNSILLRRFPGAVRSGDVTGWTAAPAAEPAIPDSPAFNDIRSRTDACGLAALAGTAVGACFVGAIAAAMSVAEASRELNGGAGTDVSTLSLSTLETTNAPSVEPVMVVALPLKTSAELV